MVIIGMGLVLAAYAAGLWGYCLVRGYNVTFAQLFKGDWPGSTAAAAPVPAADPGAGTFNA